MIYIIFTHWVINKLKIKAAIKSVADVDVVLQSKYKQSLGLITFFSAVKRFH